MVPKNFQEKMVFPENPYICTSSLFNTYQERLREWPDEALTTCCDGNIAARCQFQPRMGIDKSDDQLKIPVYQYIELF